MDGFPRGLPRPAEFCQSFADSTPQRTLKAPIDCVGVALHSGARVALSLRPAPINHGIVFRRRDLMTATSGAIDIPARFDLVDDTRLCTVLAHPTIAAARVGTVEHLMAALAGTGITNAIIEVDGPELPILDGSASSFVFLIDCAGILEQEATRRCLEILRTVRVEQVDGGFVELSPAPDGAAIGLHASLSIYFEASAIGAQSIALHITPETFRRELATARTFAQFGEIAALQAAGLARGGSLENAVVVDGARVLNPGGLRMAGEFVRHKLLDMVGDLALAGVTLHATLLAHRPGHTLNNQLLRRLFAGPAGWQKATMTGSPLALPSGAGAVPAWRTPHLPIAAAPL